MPVGRFSPGSAGYIRLPAPRTNFKGFSRGLLAACERLAIDRIIPASEEVFWLSAVRGLPRTCQGMYPSLSILGHLHSKKTFAALASQLGYGAPATHVLRSHAELQTFARQADLDTFVFKPVYSRFASEVLLSPKLDQLNDIHPTPEYPWLAQSRAYGKKVCLYNVADQGKLVLHAAYQPRWRAGKAGVYFEPVVSQQLEELSAKFIKATHFTGQISFDVIETSSGHVALECNPRGTSGAHLAAQNLVQFGAALVGEIAPADTIVRPVMLGLPHVLYNLATALTREGRCAWRGAQDAMHQAGVPLWAQVAATVELLTRTLGTGKGALEVSTADIEWNGELITL